MLLGRFEDSHQLLLGNIFVLELVPGGPAFHCEQIQVNDILFKVDQQPVKGWSLDQVAELIKGSLFLSLTFFVSVLVCICPSLRWRFFDVFVQPRSGGLDGPWGTAFGLDHNFYVASERTARPPSDLLHP